MSATEYDVMQEAQEIRRRRLDALGLGDQYDLWRESLPNGRDMSEQEAHNAFMEAQAIEQAALDGRVSVSTGGADVVPTTDIPAPGPDGQETGTDAPGDTSKGAPEGAGDDTGRDTELKAVEGMWLPPEESEALNYIEPTTEQMAGSPDWIDNAKVVWKAMGSPNPERERMEVRTTPWLTPRDEIPKIPDMTDHQIGEWARRELSLFTWNVASTMSYAHKIMTSEDPKMALAFLNLIRMYEHSDGGSVEFTRALLGIATDPTTYVGLGVGSIAARGAAKALVKSELKKAIQVGIIGASAGSFEGGTLAGGFDLVVQNIEQEAGARQDIDYGRTALATTIGVGAGTALGGSVGGLMGRRMDKIAAMHDEIQRLVEGTRILETERVAAGLSVDQITSSLKASARAAARAGKQDESAAILNRFFEEGGELPRNPDGTVDEIALSEAIKEFHDLRVGAELTAQEELARAMEQLYELDNDWIYEWQNGNLGYDTKDNPAMRPAIDKAAKGTGVKVIDHHEGVIIDGTPEQKLAFAKNMASAEGISLKPITPTELFTEMRGGQTPEEFVAKGKPKDMPDADWELMVQLAGPEARLASAFEKSGYNVIVNVDTGGLAFDKHMVGIKGEYPPMTQANIDKIKQAATRAGVKFKEFGPSDKFGGSPEGHIEIDGEPTEMKKFIYNLISQREKILPGRLGGKPFTVEEGLARGLDDEAIAKLEMNPINVVDKLERAGFKVTLSAEGEVVFDATGMSPATTERIEKVAAQTGVKAEITGGLEPTRPISADRLIAVEAPAPTDPVEKALYDAYRTLERGGTDADFDKAMQKWLNMEHERSGGELVVEVEGNGGELYRGHDLQAADKAWRVADREGKSPRTSHTTERGDFDPAEAFAPEATGTINISGDPVDVARFGAAMADQVTPTKLPIAESRAFARRILEMEQTLQDEVVAKTASLPGSLVRGIEKGTEFEVMGRTKNGWYHLRNILTGEEVNRRRNQFEVLESRPKPTMAGPMELTPFTTSAARIMAMNEDILSGKLKKVKITDAEQKAMVEDLRKMGINITNKTLSAHWTPAELLFLRDTYNAQAKGMHDLARVLGQELKNNGRLTDQQMAMFNEAHTQFVATRDLFYGVSGNAARQLQILKTRPTDEIYEFSQAIMDSLSISGGRANTERAITMMAEFAETGQLKPGQTKVGAITKMSDGIWGNKVSAGFLIVRYNMMLSSWRTHFFNFLGNSASGVYQHLGVIPLRMTISNMAHARDLALSVINPNFKPDPADRMTAHSWYAGIRSHFSSARDSFMLAKEIAMGRDIGEGKVWNELGLRYNVINVPDSAFAKLGTTPVRLLEAGDAFFKNQYYMAKIHELASMKARADNIHKGLNFETQYRTHVDSPDAPMQRMAKEYAAKQTYTNDPNVYGGILAALARGAAAAQQRNIAVNMILPFVRTPANLLSYSMEMIGANVILSPSTTYNAIMKGTAAESQEALAKLTIAAGLWIMVGEMYQNGNITGTGPSNWEERKVWEAAGWQSNSIKVYGKWYDISRADPAGQSLVSIASVFDYYAMTKEQRKPALEWIGAGLLYTADMIVDESYLSTVSDVITAIQSKEEARARSVVASLVNSVVVPNLLRDIRRATDETRRTGASENLMDQVVKQMKNASPWHSEDLPPQRDWKGDPVNYYSNAYARGFIPFDVRDPEASDPASMALAYARIPISTPNRTIEWPKGQGDGIDLFAMDEGDGFVYDKYIETVGLARVRVVKELMRKPIWRQMVKEGNIGPGSDGDNALRRAVALGSKTGRLQMLDFLIKHSGDNNSFRRANGDLILIHHPVSVQEYIRLRRMVRGEDVPVPEELRQYQIQERRVGPEFFKPRTPE